LEELYNKIKEAQITKYIEFFKNKLETVAVWGYENILTAFVSKT